MTKEEVPFLLQKVKDLEQLCSLSEVLERTANCDFMYWYCRNTAHRVAYCHQGAVFLCHFVL